LFRKSKAICRCNISSKKEDPNGSGARAPFAISAAASPNLFNGTTTTNASSSEQTFKKGQGKSGKNLAMLSSKTDKTMASYQAYHSNEHCCR
jgi:hypothetical protein